MNVSSHVSKYLSSNTQEAFAASKARANEGESPKDAEPASPNVALLRRIQRLVFSENVQTLDEAKNRLASLIDSIDDEEKESKKRPE
jgi:hypothetical protein